MKIKGFKFTLESPLSVKNIRKSQLEVELAKAKRKMDFYKKNLDLLIWENNELRTKMAYSLSEGVKAKDLKETEKYLDTLDKRIQSNRLLYHKAKESFFNFQNDLIKIMNEIDMLEKLKHKQVQEYIKAIEKKEEKEIEEVVNYQFVVRGGQMYG